MGIKHKLKQTDILPMKADVKNSYNPSAFLKILLLGYPLLGALLLFFIWFEVYKPKITNAWYQGTLLVDSATKVSDQNVKKNLMDRGGFILKQQVKLHPYHARVWFLYGNYFLANSNWDSCIYAEKKAIELGAGGVVNNVEYLAADRLNYALVNKLRGIHNLDSSIRVLNEAVTPNFENSTIDKFKGFTFYNYNQIDSCVYYLERFYSRVTNDYDVLNVLAFSFSRKGMKEKALFYAIEAKKIKNDSPDLNELINQLNAR